MTISKGAPWGITVDRPSDLLAVDSDAALAAHVTGRATADRAPVSVTAGDLFRTLGGATAQAGGAARVSVRRVPVDLLRVELDGQPHSAVAHVVARRSWLWGTVVVVANAEYLGTWDIAPRAHPNDGRADVIEVAASMSMRERLQARRRLSTGTHLPHPRLTVNRVTELDRRFDRPLDVWVDGVRHRRVRELRVTVEPDAFELHV